MISQLFTAGPFWSNPLLQSTVCIAVGLIASLPLRRRSARAHQVLLLAMIASVAVPAMSMIVRHYKLGIFVDKPAVIKSHLAEIPIVPLMTEYEISALPAIPNAYSPPAIESEYVVPAVAVSNVVKAKLSLSAILIWSWMIVSTILAARLFMTFILGIRMLRRAFPLHCEKLDKALLIAKGELGIGKPVEVLAGSTVSSPVIWCWSRRAALLVPEDAEQFEDGVDWVGMFCHELAHCSRLDHISGLFAELMVCVFPWHPLMWWAKRRLAGLSEQACDDWVVASSRCPADYAESLLDLSPQGQLSFLPAVVGRKNGLENRVRRIIKDKCGKPNLGLCWAVVVTLIAACITIGAAFAQTRPADTDQAKDEYEKAPIEKEHELPAEQKHLEQLADELKKQKLIKQKEYEHLTQQKELELITAKKQLEQLAKELKVQQIQRDELMQYHTNMQQQVDNLNRELEALKKYQADKAKLHDQISATIKEINKIRQQIHTTAPEEPVGLDASRQTAQRDHLMQFKRELQAAKDRTRQQLDGLPKEVDKLRDKLEEIEDMIRTIDSQLPSMRLQQKLIDDACIQQEMAQHQEIITEHRALIAERQALHLLAQEIEGKLKTAPEREDAEKLKERLEEYRKRIQKIDSTLRSPQWCPEKRKAEQLKKLKTPTNVDSLIEKQKTDTSCSSCHADIDHVDPEKATIQAETDQLEAQLTEWQRNYLADLKNREAEWQAEMRAFEADVVTARQKIIGANATLENDLATLEKMQQEIEIFTIENSANLKTDIALINKLKIMKANRDRLAEKIERDKAVLAQYQEELKSAEDRRDEYRKYKPAAGTKDEDAQRVIDLAKEALKRRMYDPRRTTPPSQQGQAHSPWQPQEQLQSRINQLQDQVSELRSEIKDLRKLLTDLVEHEKKRPKPSLFEIDKGPMDIGEKWPEKPLTKVHRPPLEPEKIEATPGEKKRNERPLEKINKHTDESETTAEPAPSKNKLSEQ